MRSKALAILNDPARSLPLLFTVYGMDSDEQISDWLAASLGDDAEMQVKRLLLEGFYHSRERDLIAYARRRILEEYPDV
ncbi:hypothetical protein HFQ13_09385 [Acidithiobacillus sp. VAN18-1]|uniref:Uncharacterized protein n=1 Tax=Igneacidithiobacillus copahuensis TaxID=2724909 RepID=A0AAE2YR39_9PROT|nr:hypothetical protein [Igneacidithiobacillus copahuensis]MBU2788408.1 hypothetical protein [Igneacidithiobacillus copahuensis]MBU2796923.1 hypothetical protein [Acidithiobacillus sp. VAN18-2]